VSAGLTRKRRAEPDSDSAMTHANFDLENANSPRAWHAVFERFRYGPPLRKGEPPKIIKVVRETVDLFKFRHLSDIHYEACIDRTDLADSRNTRTFSVTVLLSQAKLTNFGYLFDLYFRQCARSTGLHSARRESCYCRGFRFPQLGEYHRYRTA
jgi:hypothetical protein